MPPSFYRDAFRTIDALKPDGLAVTHSFQTNGTLVNEAWCAFFAEERVSVGVSIDGPKHLHDRHRRTARAAALSTRPSPGFGCYDGPVCHST